VFRLPT